METLVPPDYDAAQHDAVPLTSSTAGLAAVQTILSDLDSFSSRMNAVLGDAQRARRAQADAEGHVQSLQATLAQSQQDHAAALAQARALQEELAEERRTRTALQARLQTLSMELETTRQQQEAMVAQYRQLARTLAEVGEAHRALGAAEAARARAQRQVQAAYVTVAHAVEALPGMGTNRTTADGTGNQEGDASTEAARAGAAMPASAAATPATATALPMAERRRDEQPASTGNGSVREAPGVRRLTEVKAVRSDSGDETASDEVQVSAGPFLNFASVHQFRSAIAVLPGIREIRFRGFEQAQLHLTVRYDSPVPLIERLRAIGGFRPHIQMFSPTVVHLQLDASAKAS